MRLATNDRQHPGGSLQCDDNFTLGLDWGLLELFCSLENLNNSEFIHIFHILPAKVISQLHWTSNGNGI